MIGIKKEANGSNSSYWFGCRRGWFGQQKGWSFPKESMCQQQKQHSCRALTGVEMTGVGRQSWLLQTAGVWSCMFELRLNQGFSPAAFWSLETSPLHFAVIWATGGMVFCIAVFEVVNAQRSCAQLQRVLSSWNVCLHPGTEWPRGATDTTVVILCNLR